MQQAKNNPMQVSFFTGSNCKFQNNCELIHKKETIPEEILRNIFRNTPLDLDSVRLTCGKFKEIIDNDKNFTLYRFFVKALNFENKCFFYRIYTKVTNFFESKNVKNALPKDRALAIASLKKFFPNYHNEIAGLIQHTFALDENKIKKLDDKTRHVLKKTILKNIFPILAHICPEGLIKLAKFYGFQEIDAVLQIAISMRDIDFKKSFEIIDKCNFNQNEKIKAYNLLIFKRRDLVGISDCTEINPASSITFGFCDYEDADELYFPRNLSTIEYIKIIKEFIYFNINFSDDKKAPLLDLCRQIEVYLENLDAPECIANTLHFDFAKLNELDPNSLALMQPTYLDMPQMQETSRYLKYSDISPLHDIASKLAFS